MHIGAHRSGYGARCTSRSRQVLACGACRFDFLWVVDSSLWARRRFGLVVPCIFIGSGCSRG